MFFLCSCRRLLWLALLLGCNAALLIAQPAPAPSLPVQGLIVLNTGSTSLPYSNAFEYHRLETFELTYKAILPDGKPISGLRSEIVGELVYPAALGDAVNPREALANLAAQRAEMAALAERFVKAGPLLRPQLARLDAALSRVRAGEVFYAGQWQSRADYEKKLAAANREIIPAFEIAGRPYKNIKLNAVVQGELKFTHDGGAMSVPVGLLDYQTLRLCADYSPLAQADAEMKAALAAYHPVLTVNGRPYKGVRVQGVLDDKITLLTGEGRVVCWRNDLPKETLDALAAKSPELRKNLERWHAETAPTSPAALANAQAGYQEALAAEARGDQAEAIRLYQKAADAGSVKARVNAAALMLGNLPTPEQTGTARQWLEDAFEKNQDPLAAYNLGLLALRETKVGRSNVQCLHYFQSAAELGMPQADYILGVLYARGQGVAADQKQSRIHFERALLGGVKAAWQALEATE